MGLRERYGTIVERLVAGLRAHYGDRLISVALFGSVARETPREDSDIDFLIVARDLPRGRTARVAEFLPVERQLESWLAAPRPGLLPIALSPVFKSPEEVEAGSPLFLDMIEDARILYDREALLEPPKIHDVGGLLVEHTSLFVADVRGDLSQAATISKRLRRDRELAFYGDVDFIPTEEFTDADARAAYNDAAWVVGLAARVIDRLTP